MSRFHMVTGAAIIAVALAVGCAEVAPPAGRVTFTHYCAGCHGSGGMGDGPAAAKLPIAPADLTILRETNDGAFPAEYVMATVYGYPGRHKFGVMPEFGPLLDGPKQIWVSPKGEEIMTPVALVELATYIETLQR